MRVICTDMFMSNGIVAYSLMFILALSDQYGGSCPKLMKNGQSPE
jgi:hypothetical protein